MKSICLSGFFSLRNTRPCQTIFTGPTTGTLLVSKKFRAFIEAWDPVEHRYIPVAIRIRSGEILLDDFFIFLPQEPVENGIVVEESDVRDHFVRGKMRRYLPTAQRPRLMWRKSVIGERHLWTDRHLQDEISTSDALYEEMKKQGVCGYQAHEARFSKIEL